MNQHYFTEKQLTKNELPESTMKELRNTHFHLGAMPQNYQTESGYYKHPSSQPPGTSNMDFKIPTYESGTWVDKEARFKGTTTNQKELPARETKPFEKASQAHRPGIELGGHQPNYQSEFKSK